MSIGYSIAIVALAALVHACFQLSISVLTLLSSHALGAKKSQSKLIRLTTGFVVGSVIMTVLLISDGVLVLYSLFKSDAPQMLWTVACGLSLGVAIAIWLFYFQKGPGTMLWIPRGMAKYLDERSKITKSSAESFSLGLVSVFGELMFVIAPIFVAALAIISLPSLWQLAAIAIYTVISMISLLIVWMLIGSGHSLSKIQKWREKNKRFLQFTAGAGLAILAFFVFVNEVLVNAIGVS